MSAAELDAVALHAEILRGMAETARVLAEPAVYTPPGGAPVACTVRFRAPTLQDADSAAPIVAQSRRVLILRADVPLPGKNATIALGSDPSVRWRLVDILDDGIGSTAWSVIRV